MNDKVGRYQSRNMTEVEAVQWTGSNEADVQALFAGCESRVHVAGDTERRNIGPGFNSAGQIIGDLYLSNRRGIHDPLHVAVGDWLVKGRQGEPYIVKPDLFHAIFDGWIGQP